MAKIIRLTETDLTRIVKRVIKEQTALGTHANIIEIGVHHHKLLVKTLPITVLAKVMWDALSGNSKGVLDALNQYRQQLGKDYETFHNALTKGDVAKTLKNIADGLQNIAKQYGQGLGNKY